MQTGCWMLGMLKWKAAHPQRSHKCLSGRECVSGGRDVEWGWGGGGGWIRPALFHSVGSDAGVVSTEGLWERHWRKCTHCLCSFFLHSVIQGLLRKSRSYSFWPTPLPSLNSSSSYQHYSFSAILWLMSFLVLLWVKFVFIAFCIRWLFFSTGLHDQKMQTRLKTALNILWNLHNYPWHRWYIWNHWQSQIY